MPKIRIKQLNERVATTGLHMGDAEEEGMHRRKLEPGEVVDIPEHIVIVSNRLDEPMPLIDMLYDTGLVDILPDREPVTRPLDYLNYREATLCAPSFNPLSASEESEQQTAMDRVAQRLAKQAEPVEEDDPPPQRPVVRGRRGGRRSANHGQAHPT